MKVWRRHHESVNNDPALVIGVIHAAAKAVQRPSATPLDASRRAPLAMLLDEGDFQDGCY
jgi:hypothetical protein